MRAYLRYDTRTAISGDGRAESGRKRRKEGRWEDAEDTGVTGMERSSSFACVIMCHPCTISSTLCGNTDLSKLRRGLFLVDFSCLLATTGPQASSPEGVAWCCWVLLVKVLLGVACEGVAGCCLRRCYWVMLVKVLLGVSCEGVAGYCLRRCCWVLLGVTGRCLRRCC